LDLGLTAEQHALVEAFGTFFAREVRPERVRTAEPLGFDAELWSQLAALGIPSAAVGDQPASLLDLALICEQAGRRLAPVPIAESLAAARLLAGFGVERPERAPASLAIQPTVGGVARLVPAGAVAALVVVLDGDRLVAVRPDAVTPPSSPANLGCSPLADIAVDGRAELLTGGPTATTWHAGAVADWKVLTAAALCGLAAEALAIGVAYVKARHQFGVAIGSFQAVQHRLADVATAVDGARLLAYRAAWGLDAGRADGAEKAAMALLFAGETAQRAAAASLQFHGGYGFMVEYDIQLYYRRAKAWLLAAGDPRRQLQQIAALRYAPAGGGH